MLKKTLLSLACLASLTIAGEFHSVIIRDENEHKPCCECNCEYDPECDVTYYGEDIRWRYKYFGGVPHICVGNHNHDEKGIDLTKEHKPHVCKGEWCDAKCCYTVEDYFHIRYEHEKETFGDIIGGHRPYPVIPTPPPVSADH